jgi:hypothetical protein
MSDERARQKKGGKLGCLCKTFWFTQTFAKKYKSLEKASCTVRTDVAKVKKLEKL